MDDLRSASAIDRCADLIDRHAAEIPVWGHFPAAMRFKQAVVSRVGCDAAFNVATSVLRLPGVDILRRRPIRSLRDTARQQRDTFRELWPASPSYVLPSPHVIGEGNHEPMVATGRSAYLACFDSVHVRGRSPIVRSDADALIDYEGDELRRFTDNFEFDPGVLHSTADELWMFEPLTPSMVVDEAFMLIGSHTIDFGHWMTEYLPKYIIATLCGLPPDMPVLVDERMPRSHFQSLELVCPGTRLIVVPHLAPVTVNHLWCASNPMYMGFYPTTWTPDLWRHTASEPTKTAALMRELVRLVASTSDPPTAIDRVFMARKHRKKKLLNANEIEAAAEARGFVVLHPEELSFAEQFRLARQARYIVGPEGSALFLSELCAPGARVCILSPRYTLPLGDTCAVLRALDVDATVLTGPDRSFDDDWPFWVDYEIDPVVFSDFLDHWLPD